MGRFMKPGKVVLVLGGRYAGRKAVIVKVSFVACKLKQFSMDVKEISHRVRAVFC